MSSKLLGILEVFRKSALGGEFRLERLVEFCMLALPDGIQLLEFEIRRRCRGAFFPAFPSGEFKLCRFSAFIEGEGNLGWGARAGTGAAGVQSTAGSPGIGCSGPGPSTHTRTTRTCNQICHICIPPFSYFKTTGPRTYLSSGIFGGYLTAAVFPEGPCFQIPTGACCNGTERHPRLRRKEREERGSGGAGEIAEI